MLNEILADYKARVNYVVENEDFHNTQQDAQHRRAVYEWLYHEVNITHDNTLFYLVDTQWKILLSNRKKLPVYMEDTPMTWGLWQRLRAEPDRVLVEFSPRMDNKNSDLLVAYICDIVRTGAAPVEFVTPSIRDIIISERKHELVKGLEQDLLDRALESKEFEIYRKR